MPIDALRRAVADGGELTLPLGELGPSQILPFVSRDRYALDLGG